MSKVKSGIMCWINGRCQIPENIGAVVEVVEFHSVADGLRWWHVRSGKPLLCQWVEDPGVYHYRTDSICAESALTPINSGDLQEDVFKSAGLDLVMLCEENTNDPKLL